MRKPSLPRRALGVIVRSVNLGGRSGRRTCVKLLIVMVPVMIVMTGLEALRVLPSIATVFEPVMRVLALPGNSALAFISGATLNLYAAVAVAGNVTLTVKQMTVLAVLCLDCHNLPVESAIQRQAGTNVPAMIVVRFLTAFVGALLFAWLIPETGAWAEVVTKPRAAVEAAGAWQVVGERSVANAWMLGKVVLIVMALMIVVELMRQTGLLGVLTALMRPVTWIAGLPRLSAFTVMASSTLGLAYAAGLVIDEARKGLITREGQFRTNVFIGTTHSIFEDTLLFAVIGASLWWILLGRLVLGCVAVRFFALIHMAWTRRTASANP